MNRKSSTVLIGSVVIGIAIMLAIYMGLIVTGVIDTRPSTLIVSVGSAQKEFDGTPLTCEEYTLQKGTLKKGHTLDVTFGAQQTDVGTTENVATVQIRDALGADVTNHYKIETRPGKLTVTTCSLVFKSVDEQKMYDGQPLTAEQWYLVLGKLPEGYLANATFTGVQVEPGQSSNDFAVTIYDENGIPVGQNFEITLRPGKLTVTKRSLVVTSYGASKTYDGLPLHYESYTVDGEVLSEHYLNVTFPASITEVGSVTNNINVQVMENYRDVTDFYEIGVRVGVLTVQPRPIEVSASPCIKHYTGEELPEGQWYLTKGSLVEGHELYAEVEAVKNEMDTVEFLLRKASVSAAGIPVTQNYEISLVHGVDTDRLEKLTVVSGSKAAPFTGEPLTYEQYVLLSGVLAEGHVIEPHFTGSQTEIGFSDNTFTVSVIDQYTGEDVTYRYDIAYEFGTLEVYDTAPSTGGEISDDGSLDNDVRDQDAVAARILAENGGRVYLRWKSYGNYTYREEQGNWGWSDALSYPLATQNMLFTTGQALASNGKIPTAYQIELFGNQYLTPNYVADGAQGAYNDVVMSPYTESYELYGYNWTYSYADALRYAAQGVADEQMLAYAGFVYEQYLDVPESTKQALLAFAEQHGLKADHLSIIEDVAALVRSSAVYDMEYPACPEGKDEVVYFLTESQSGVCRHFASAATLLYRSLGIPARYVVGYSTYAASGDWTDVKGADAHAWVEVFIAGLGWVRIDPTPAQNNSVTEGALVLQPIKVMGYYTGLPYAVTAENVMITQGALQAGHSLGIVTVSGSRTEAGTSPSVIESVTIVDENGVDVTSQYQVVCLDGVIEVKKPILTVYAASAKKQDDGTLLTAPSYTSQIQGGLGQGAYTVQASVNGKQLGVGQSQNEVGEVTVLDLLGRDVTRNFEIKRVSGTLKLYLYELMVETESKTQTYTGAPLSADQITYDSLSLQARGHRLEYTMPSLTNVGAVSNTPTCRVLDQSGKDVSAQYDIVTIAGVLRVNPIQLTLRTDSASKTYDGTALRADGFTLVSGTLAKGQSIAAYKIKGSQTNVGVSESTVTDLVILDAQERNVTANYQIIIISGTLSVLAP